MVGWFVFVWGWLVGWLLAWLVGWFVFVWLVGWLLGCLVGCLVGFGWFRWVLVGGFEVKIFTRTPFLPLLEREKLLEPSRLSL